ncbi:DUF7948 domain-containing protein [Acidiluteibacter ferrifornacis]|uniref:T9SS type B sorting domain-containing protein n=1 Tax=Acidiluteibacter ferrifornacis TaxID=2692424 RepID=A0A6N9NP06_9FLAO|nr:gliding motility-associated C-terminal domain-containing protein [Acidiluteibacter ferrifornacis]NBG66245.1 T9SS type B sorting domain-containing protein [Acidiluteibacter ferrifornacis]
MFILLALSSIIGRTQGTPFIENKGQWPKQVYFKANISSGGLFLEKTGFTYYFYSNGEHEHGSIEEDHNHLHEFKESVIKTTFLNINPCPKIIKSGEQSTLYNYFLGNDPKKWGAGAKAFETVIYKNIYEGIDLKIYQSQENGYKYDYILAPYAHPKAIQTKYSGYNRLEILNGDLIISHEVGQLIEVKPYAYQFINGQKIEVPCQFQVNDSIVSFRFPNGYDNSQELIVDPDLIFSTFSGSTSDNFGMTATYDSQGNGYTGGVVFGNGYPTTPNMAQDTFGKGMVDVAISKFSSDGSQLLYTTYFGGSGTEMIHSMVVNSADELLFYGTTSSRNLPTTPLSLFDTLKGGTTVAALQYFSGGSDIFLAKISANGDQFLSSTYLGGSENDGLNLLNNTNGGDYSNRLLYGYGDQARGEINIDQFDNVYLMSSTYSTDFPVTSGSYSTTLNGKQDAIIAKFSPDLNNLLWCTYLGGSENEVGYAVRINNSGDVYVAGGTISTDFPTSINSYNPTYNGGVTDGFVSRLSQDGTTLKSSTFLGTNNYDQTHFLDIDKYGEIYAFGHSYGGNFPVNNVNYVDSGAGQYVIKLDSNLSTNIFSTTVGSRSGTGKIDFSPTAFLVDRCQNIYISGWGARNSTFPGLSLSQALNSSMPITPDAFKPTTHGGNFYFMVLRKDADSLVFGSFFGGTSPSREHVDGGTSRFDQDGVIYQSVCAGCGGNSNFPVKNAYFPTNGSSNCNNALFKVSLTVNPEAKLYVEKDSVCAPANIEFKNTSTNSNYFYWHLGNGEIDSTNKVISRTFSQPGVYSIKLVVGDSICGTSDTLVKEVKVFSNDLNMVKLKDTILCSSDSILLYPNFNGTVLDIIWSDTRDFKDRLNPIGDYFINVWTPFQKKYYLELRGPGCSIFDSITVTNNVLDNNFILSDTAGCSPLKVDLTNLSTNFDSLVWSFDGQVVYNLNSITHAFNTPGSYSIELKTISQVCNKELTQTKNINVFQSIQIKSLNDTSVCEGENLTINLNDFNTANHFIWSSDSKFTDTLSTTKQLVLNNVTIPQQIYLHLSNDHCDTIVSFSIAVPIVNISLLDSINKCKNDTIEIKSNTGNSSSNLTYKWTPMQNIINGANTPQIITNTNNNTTYYLDVSNKLGCHYKDSVFVKVTTPITNQLLPFSLSDSVPIGKTIVLESDIIKDSFIYQWQPEQLVESPHLPLTKAVAKTDTIYRLYIFDPSSGCSYQGKLRIRVYDDECNSPHIFVPSAFTPNNDLNNDVLQVRGDLIETFTFQIFNRWGELIFESNDLTIGWDGTYKGEEAAEGVYVFQLKAKCYSGQEYFLKGDVTLIR